ncbi:hypothetical protein PENTCL1PPCAC_30357 [Pristionchus entomophagus]|uniref:Uncharacterized protein n=1 Tax=Pristionchus entomophagus TaxID=358040 RepID=A0AAV5UPT9_9BILA|nr:hypothetical protein PENTCL1PPCAC_29945 [Pristionchus entomophagus]GMT08183.1 hypothetical protein PENTCL1PPCAC_30357 [Pristionchus entomophagus]
MRVVYYPYLHPGERPKGGDKPVWSWHETLKDEARTAMADTSDKLNVGTFAPMGAFHEPPMRGELVSLVKGTLVEVELPANDKMRTDTLDKTVTPVWIAECIHMIGYYILARWCGAKREDEGYFWLHSANAALHQVGYAEKKKTSGYALVPPFAMFLNETEKGWQAHLTERILNRYTTGDEFDQRGSEISRNKFRAGERVETIHDEESSVLCPAMIKKVLGRRVLLEYSRSDIDKADLVEKDNMWRDMNDDLIYPVGFAQTMGLRMTATKKYMAHVGEIAAAIKNGGDVPYFRTDAKKETVYQWRENKHVTSSWQVNMVCEMIDRLDECQNVLKAARILAVLPDGYLQIGPEGPDIVNDSFYVHQTTTILFPVGYAKDHNIVLQGPKGDKEEAFQWDSFLKRTNYTPAPSHFFHEATASDVPFKAGMRLEAIDQNEKMLCPATVKEVKGRLVLVAFDGWAEEYDQLYDFRSNELLPCGWGEMVGHALQAPAKPAEAVLEAEEVSGDEAMEE